MIQNNDFEPRFIYLAMPFLMCNEEESMLLEIDNCPLKLFNISKMGLETVLLDVSAEPPQLSLIDETSGKFALAQNFCQEKVRILHLAIVDIAYIQHFGLLPLHNAVCTNKICIN